MRRFRSRILEIYYGGRFEMCFKLIKRVKKTIITNLKNHSFFYQVLSIFSAFMLAFTLVAILFFKISNQSREEELLLNSAINFSRNVQENTNLIHSYYLNSSVFLTNDNITSNLNNYVSLTPEQRVNLVKIAPSIRSLTLSLGDDVDRCFMYIDTMKIYTSTGAFDFNFFFENYYRYDDYDKDYWIKSLYDINSFRFLNSSMVVCEGKRYDIFPMLISNYKGREKYSLIINIKIDALLSRLGQHEYSDFNTYLIGLPGEDHIYGNNHIFKQEFLDEMKMEFSDAGKISIILNYKDSAYTAIRQTDNFGITYYCLQDLSKISVLARETTQSIFFAYIIFAIVALAFIIYISILLNRPVQRIHRLLGTYDGGMEFEHSTFLNTIGQRMEKIVSKYDTTMGKLAYLNVQFADVALLGAIEGRLQPQQKEEILGFLHQRMGFETGHFSCINLRILFNERYAEDIPPSEQLVFKKQLKGIMQVLFQDHIPTYIVEYSEYFYMALIDTPLGNGLISLNRALAEICDIFQYDYRYCQIHVGISASFSEIEEIPKFFDQAETAMYACNSAMKFDVRRLTHLPSLQKAPLPEHLSECIWRLFQSGNQQALFELIADIKDKWITNEIAASRQRTALYEIFSIIAEQASSLNIEPEEVIDHALYSKMMYFALERKLTLDEGYRALLAFFAGVCEQVNIRENNKSSEQMDRIANYIKENCQQDIYLENIAHKFLFSAKYLSRIFKQNRGISISDYIAGCRIERAKALLIGTSKSVNEIAEMVSIPSRTTFFRLFKKSEGISPNEYRMNK